MKPQVKQQNKKHGKPGGKGRHGRPSGGHHGGLGGGHHGGKPKQSWQSKFLDKPGFLNKPVTHKEFKKELRSARRLEFGPATRQLQAEQRASDLQQKNITGYFKAYDKALKPVQGQTKQAYREAEKYTANQTKAQAGYSQKLNTLLNAQDSKDAQLRGATVDSKPQENAAKAATSRFASGNNFGGMIASQGASQRAFLADKSRIGKGEEIHQHLTESARKRSLDADLRDLAEKKRVFAADFINQMRPQERDFYLAMKQAQLSKQASKLSARTSRKNAKLSAKVSLENAALSAATSRGNAKLSSKTSISNAIRSAAQSNLNSIRSAHTSRANSKRTAKNSKRSNRRQNREFNLTHTQGGKTKGTVGSNSGSGGAGKAAAELRYYASTHGKFSSKSEAMAVLIHAGFSRNVAKKAIKHLAGGKGGKHNKPTIGGRG